MTSPLRCLDRRTDNPCSGEVEYRMALSGTGKSFPRCEKHWEQRVRRQEENDRKYPAHPPSDFDPSYAGERWYEE